MAERAGPLLQLGRHLGDTAGRLMLEAARLRAAAIDPDGQPRRGPGWRLLNGFSTSLEQLASGLRGLGRPLSRGEQALHLPGFTREDLAVAAPTSPVEDELLEAERQARAFADGIRHGRESAAQRNSFERRFGRVWFRFEVVPASGGLHVSVTPQAEGDR